MHCFRVGPVVYLVAVYLHDQVTLQKMGTPDLVHYALYLLALTRLVYSETETVLALVNIDRYSIAHSGRIIETPRAST